MSLLRHFDEVTAKIIGKIPRSAHRPFSLLGIAALPSVWATVVVVLLIFHALTDNVRWEAADVFVLLLLPLSTLLKLFIRRQRPQTIYAEAMRIKSYSFPSSHAYTAALAGGYVATMTYDTFAQPWSSVLASGIVLVILLIGISRVHLGAHYPSDVIAGQLLGIVTLAAILSLAMS